MKFIDLFAGIGGMRIAFESAGCECVWSSEYNKFAAQTYEANYGYKPAGDITRIHARDIPEHDILVGGFPCQPFSIAGVSKKNSLGKAHGFMDATQGTLFFDVARIIEYHKPIAFLLENVKNLVSHDRGNTFNVINNILKELGYVVYAKVIDAKNYVPQHRERIYIAGFRNDLSPCKFEFPNKTTAYAHSIASILEYSVDERYTLSDKLWNCLQKHSRQHKEKGNGFGFGLTNRDGIARTLSARYYKDGSEILIPQDGRNPRRLTPRECARLMGFPDTFKIVCSDTQAYKQFGNSVVVPLVSDIANAMVASIKTHTQ